MSDRDKTDPACQEESWDRCARGQLRGVAHELRTRQRRRTIGRGIAGSSALVLLVVALAVAVGNPFGSSLPGDIACEEVQAVIADYFADRLPPPRHAQVEAHLAGCEACCEHFLGEPKDAAHGQESRETALQGRQVPVAVASSLGSR